MSEQPNVKCLLTPVAISFGYDGFNGYISMGSLPHNENRRTDGGLNYVTDKRQVPPATE
jgi:hypothetical protein